MAPYLFFSVMLLIPIMLCVIFYGFSWKFVPNFYDTHYTKDFYKDFFRKCDQIYKKIIKNVISLEYFMLF